MTPAPMGPVLASPPAVDSHVHLFDPDRFPYGADASYRPAPHETATCEQLLAVLDAQGLSHAIVVTPTSGYGPDNAAAADAIARHPQRLKGIAVVDDTADAAGIAALKAAGFAGLRLDLSARGIDGLLGAGRHLVATLRDLDMVLQIQAPASAFDPAVCRLLRREAGRVVIDHMALPDPRGGLDQSGFDGVLRLADCAAVAVKLSGPFRFSRETHPYADADRFAAAVVAAFGPERCLWGSDWPFVRMARRMDYGPCLAALERWLPDSADRRTVLWDTPRRLFGLEPVG